MIFAEMIYDACYEDVHPKLHAFLVEHFSNVESGLQGDSYFWVKDGEERVAIDTFTSMRHQIKSSRAGTHVQNVLEKLATIYEMKVYAQPVLEGHEDV